MRKGKIKAFLFIVIFLLVMATAITLLLDMESERKEVAQLGYDPYIASPTPTERPVVTQAPVATIMPTPYQPTPAPTPVPTPMPTPVPTPTPAPYGQTIGSGVFESATGVPLNVQAVWTAQTLDAEHVYVRVEVSLISYSLQIIAAHNAVNVSVGDSYLSADTPYVDLDDNANLHTTPIAVTEHVIDLPAGQTRSFPVQVQYLFRGVYFHQEIDTIECGGSIQLSR